MAKKRSSIEKLCFVPAKLPSNILPTKEQVIRAICFEKEENKIEYKSAIKRVSIDIIQLWEKASVPVVSEKGVSNKVSRCFNNYIKIKNGNSSSSVLQQKAKDFKVCLL